MRAILISINPKWLAKILNGEKTIEIRKTCPEMFKHLKPYEGYSIDVYIYCTKGKPSVNIWTSKTPEKVSKAILSIDEQQEDNDLDLFMNLEFMQKYPQYSGQRITFSPTNLNGKVVAKFTLNRVEEIIFGTTLYNDLGFFTGDLYSFDLYKQSCLTKKEMQHYLKVKPNGLSGYAWHISNLEVFDKPKELSEFEKVGSYNNPTIKCKKKEQGRCNYGKSPFTGKWVGCEKARLTKAPQSWCYVE